MTDPARVKPPNNWTRPHIDVVNASTVMKDKDVEDIVAAVQIQINRDLRYWWDEAKLEFVPTGRKPAADHWWVAVLDDSDVAGALGYHDLTTAGLPLGKVFAGTDIQYGYLPSITASHEILEMIGDPYIQTCSYVEYEGGGGRLYAYENADAVEADEDGYDITIRPGVTVRVSDFVFPSWFLGYNPPKGPHDFLEKVMKPLQLLEGGYISYYDVGAGSGWQQEVKRTNADRRQRYRDLPRLGSRRERRARATSNWVLSEVDAQ